MFSFASKMLNTIMGTEDGQPGQVPGPGQQQYGMQQPRPMGGFQPQVRPGQQPMGTRPFITPAFTGPRPNAIIRGGPPQNLGGPTRPIGGQGTPHRFNGPQPAHPMPQGMQPSPGQGGIRGPVGPGSIQSMGMRQRAPQPRQQFQQKIQAQNPPAGAGAQGLDLDLSHLSVEERKMIESVMVKAQQLEQEVPPVPVPQSSSMGQPGQASRMMRMDDPRQLSNQPDEINRLCPLCRQRDISGRDGHPPHECAECHNIVCNRCGGIATHPETKRPEWTCGACIKRRRVMAQGGSTMNQQNLTQQQQRQLGNYGAYQQQSGMEWDNTRRGSGGPLGIGVANVQGGSTQQWKSETNTEPIESKELMEEDRVKQSRTIPFEREISPEYFEELDQSSMSSHSVVQTPSLSTHDSRIPPGNLPSMNIPQSVSARDAKPSFVKLRSRSGSLEVSEDEGIKSKDQNSYVSTSYNGRVEKSAAPESDKADHLMEELSKLQSAVESYSYKRKEREFQPEPDPCAFIPYAPSPTPPSPLRSPSPKPSPPKSPESLSPLPSPISLIQSPGDSPESPESQFPAPRKAIVVKENELDDYRSSTDEETESDSDEEHKIISAGTGEVTSFYDHSPGEVYTIPEEEDEGGSPTGADLVTSLNRPGIQGQGQDIGSPRRRMMAQECLPTSMGMMHDQKHGPRPHIRSQRSLENRTQGEFLGQVDMQGNMSYNSNLNTQMQNQLGVDNQSMMGQNITGSTQQTAAMSASAGSLSQQSSYHAAPLSSMPSNQPQQQSLDSIGAQGPSQQQYQVQHKPTDCSMEWNNNLNHTEQPGMGGFADSTSVATSLGQAYQSVQTQQFPSQSQFQQQQQYQTQAQQIQNQQMQQLPQSHQQNVQNQQQTLINQQQQQLNQQQQQLLQQQQQQFSQQQQQQAQNQQQFLQQQQNLASQTNLQSQQQYPNQQQQDLLHSSQQIQSQLSTQQLGQQPTGSQQQHPQFVNPQQNVMQQPQNTQMQGLHASQQQMIPNIAQPNFQHQHIDIMSSQPSQTHPTGIAPQQQLSSMAHDPNYSQQISWSSPGGYDTGPRLGNSPCPSPFSQSNQNIPLQQYQPSASQNMTQQQFQQMGVQQQLVQGSSVGLTVPGQPIINTTNAGPSANKSISGLLADFSRALGLGSTPPRPSPSDERSELFPTRLTHEDGLSPYEQYIHQPSMPSQTHLSQIQQQSSAFTPIQDMHHIYSQQPTQHHGTNQQLSYLTQQQQSNIQPSLQNLQYGIQSLPTSQQQYLQSLASQQTGHGSLSQGIIHPVPTLGVGMAPGTTLKVSPAQAHMYQQQMALQHQAQHMKKSSRRAHSAGGDYRKDAMIIGGQNLTVGPSGMTIGGLTPAVVTSLGTFIGGGPILGTSLLQQPLAVTPLGTPIGTPVGTPRSGREPCTGDSSDTMSETDSQKSLRMRRKLPCLPPDQEAAPLPSTKKRDRQRFHEFRSLSPMRVTGMETAVSKSYPMSSLGLSRPSASESNLRRITIGTSDTIPRPGSALGLLQGSSIVSSIGGKTDSVYPVSGNLFSTSSVFPGMRFRPSSTGVSSAELAACLPPDLRHLLNKGDSEFSEFSDLSGLTSSLGETSLNVGSHLPSYMKTIREQLQEERRQLLSEERRRLELLRERDRELGARLDAVTSRAGTDSLRSRTDLTKHAGISRSIGTSPLMSRKLKGHHRQLSDPKLSLPFSPIKEDGELPDFERGSAGILKHKSYEYESLEGFLGDWDHSQSYLNTTWASAGGVLRETAIHSLGSAHEGDGGFSRLASSYLFRRGSEGEPWSPLTHHHSSSRDKRYHFRKHRKSRSWNPSPYVSEEDDEDDDITREEKKARIKAEIAKRRQQIQERGSLHQDYSSRITKMHDSSGEEHSILKSVDQLIRDQLLHDDYGRYEMNQPAFTMGTVYPSRESHRMASAGAISPCPSEEDRSIERIASTFGADEYSYLRQRLAEVSPGESELHGVEIPMPLLEDMPTRSRRLLEDLGCSVPLSHSHLSEGTGGNIKGIHYSNAKLKNEDPETHPNPSEKGQTEWGSNLNSPVSCEEINPLQNEEDERVTSDKEYEPSFNRRAFTYPEDENGQGPKSKCARLSQSPQPEQPPENPPASQEEESRGFPMSDPKYPFPTKRILLAKSPAGKEILKIVGGKEMPFSGGVLHAYVSKLYPWGPESLDIEQGDIVLEWNGISLENKTFEEVQPIVNDWDGEVEILLRGNYNILTGKERSSKDFDDSSHDSDGNLTNVPEAKGSSSRRESFRQKRNSSADTTSTTNISSQMFRQLTDDEEEIRTRYRITGRESPATSTTETTVTSISQQPTTDTESHSRLNKTVFKAPSLLKRRKTGFQSSLSTPKVLVNNNELTKSDNYQQARSKNGLIKLQICHDPKASVLYVTVVKAKFPKHSTQEGADQIVVDPYIVVYLLPEKTVENQRRTRHIPMSQIHLWNQTMVYPNVSVKDLGSKSLEVTAWNYNCSGDDTSLGKIILKLSDDIVDEQPHYYILKSDVNTSKLNPKLDQFKSRDGKVTKKRPSKTASPRSSIAPGIERRPTLSLLSSTNIPTKSRSIPSDCHENMCSIL